MNQAHCSEGVLQDCSELPRVFHQIPRHPSRKDAYWVQKKGQHSGALMVVMIKLFCLYHQKWILNTTPNGASALRSRISMGEFRAVSMESEGRR